MRNKKSLGSTILIVVVGIISWFLKEKGFLNSDGSFAGKPLSTTSTGSGDFTKVALSGQGWELLSDCQLITGRNSDGDSFHVKHEKGETEFRLYFVDAPESSYKTYGGGENNGKRLAEQGQYFGGLDQSNTTKVGSSAKALVKKALTKKDFKILTKWEDVYGPDRKYCLAVVNWEGQDLYLHELIVAQGLGRIHTRGADLPDGRRYQDQKKHLKSLEQAASEKKVGAWGL